jgi:hypothetical protein
MRQQNFTFGKIYIAHRRRNTFITIFKSTANDSNI